MEHHGLTFCPAYKPLPDNIKMKVKATGQEIKISSDVEEIARWWADVETTEFAAPQRIKDNFWDSFKPKLDQSLGLKSIEEIDFEPLRLWKEK